LEASYGEEYAAWLEELGAAREGLRAKATGLDRIKVILHRLASREMFDRFRRRPALSARQQGALQ